MVSLRSTILFLLIFITIVTSREFSKYIPDSIAEAIPVGNLPDTSAITNLFPTGPNTGDSSLSNPGPDSIAEAIPQSILPGMDAISSVFVTGSLPNTWAISSTNPGSNVLPIFPVITGNGIGGNPSKSEEVEAK